MYSDLNVKLIKTAASKSGCVHYRANFANMPWLAWQAWLANVSANFDIAHMQANTPGLLGKLMVRFLPETSEATEGKRF